MLVVSFNSRGEGPDRKAVPEFEAYQKELTQTLGKDVFTKGDRRGREGEFSVNINLQELSKKDKKKVLTFIRDFDQRYDLVLLEEK